MISTQNYFFSKSFTALLIFSLSEGCTYFSLNILTENNITNKHPNTALDISNSGAPINWSILNAPLSIKQHTDKIPVMYIIFFIFNLFSSTYPFSKLSTKLLISSGWFGYTYPAIIWPTPINITSKPTPNTTSILSPK